MNKAELIEAVQKNLGGDTSKRAASDALDAASHASNPASAIQASQPMKGNQLHEH